MSSYPTQPAFVVDAQGWDDALLQHPVTRFLYAHEKVFDAKDVDGCRPFYHPDMVYTRSGGQTFSGPAAVEALHADYALFAAYFHEPVFGMVTQTSASPDVYRLFGQARMFVDLPDAKTAPAAVQKEHSDLQGRRWECQAQGSFLFEIVSTPDGGPLGYRIARFQVFADPTPILGVAVRRGILPVEALTP